MGWIFRKSKKVGPITTTISQKGVGASINILGVRLGITPEGKRYLSLGVPGTGLRFMKYFKKK